MVKLSTWCKEVKKELVMRDWTMDELCEELRLHGTPLTRSYVSAIVNGRIYSKEGVKNISEVLGIEPQGNTLRTET